MSDDSQKCAPTFGAGQKNNPSHGPVAQVTMAPLIYITDIIFIKTTKNNCHFH